MAGGIVWFIAQRIEAVEKKIRNSSDSTPKAEEIKNQD
jgi:hypothetical protein